MPLDDPCPHPHSRLSYGCPPRLPQALSGCPVQHWMLPTPPGCPMNHPIYPQDAPCAPCIPRIPHRSLYSPTCPTMPPYAPRVLRTHTPPTSLHPSLARWGLSSLCPWILLEKPLFPEVYKPLEAPELPRCGPAATRAGASISIPEPQWDQRANPQQCHNLMGSPQNQGIPDSPPDLPHPVGWGPAPSRSPSSFVPMGDL